MTNDAGRKPEGAPERSPKAGAGAPSGVDGNGLIARPAPVLFFEAPKPRCALRRASHLQMVTP
jgi:hypothetical protein